MATHSRLDRVAELIQQEIGRMLTRGLKDPRIGFVTITGAKVSPDLREAWVYYAVHGDERVRQETALGLEAASGFIRHEVGQAIALRVTPKIHFVVDEAIDRGDRIEQLLREVHKQDEARAPAKSEGGEDPSQGEGTR
jgi:ribosome-binding factor A